MEGEPVTGKVIGFAIEVHRVLGKVARRVGLPGFAGKSPCNCDSGSGFHVAIACSPTIVNHSIEY